MATMYDDVDAICPYYRRSEKAKIVCESTGNYALELAFDKRDDRKAHKKDTAIHLTMGCALSARSTKKT